MHSEQRQTLYSWKARSDYNDEDKPEKRTRTIRVWQQRCHNFHIKLMDAQADSKYPALDCAQALRVHYRLTLFLARHSGYRRYLHRFRQGSSFRPMCPRFANERK